MRKILIIDDDIRFRDSLLPLLSSYEFEVSECETLNQATKLMGLYRFDFVVVCGRFDEARTIETLRSIRQSNPNLHMMFISNGPCNDRSAAAMRDEHLLASVKPKSLGPDEICREIDEILRTNLKPKKPTFTFERKNIPGLTNTGQFKVGPGTTSTPKSPSLNSSSMNPSSSPSSPSLSSNSSSNKDLDIVMPLPKKVSDIENSENNDETNDNELTKIRKEMQRALHAPDRIDFDALLARVAEQKTKAVSTGQNNVALLMKRIETYLNLFLGGIETESIDSFEILITELHREGY